jgi:VanZ family protein
MTNLFKYFFYTSVLTLIIISLYPGSLIGFLLYNDLYKQVNLVENPFGTSFNHFISYLYISILGFFLHMKSEKFKKIVYLMFALSVILELLHFIIPVRALEFYDLVANFLGVLVAYFLVKIYLHFIKYE